MAWKAPKASAFRARLALERRSTVSDDMGGTLDQWETLETNIAAFVQHARGGEQVQADRLSSVSNVDITIRQSFAFKPRAKDRLRDLRNDDVYSIKWVGQLDQSDRFLVIAATLGEVAS